MTGLLLSRLHRASLCGLPLILQDARLGPRVLLILVFIFSIAKSSGAQSVIVHNHSPAAAIDGALHPEQIPDIVAYRLVLLGLSTPANPTDAQNKRHLAQFALIGMNDSDNQKLVPILSRFSADYHEMIETYNEAATAANASGQRADTNSFLLKRDQFLQSVHDQLKNALSAEGWGRFDGFVQSNKRHMKISVAEASR